MHTLKHLAKRIPGALFLRNKWTDLALKLKSTEDIFTDIYVGNKWEGKDSVSGKGSDLRQTRAIMNRLPALLAERNVRTMLDIPCGDFHWMQHVNLEGLDYTGADIVADLIEKNKQQYETENIHFCQLNVIKDKLPQVDLVFCRDCLIHLSLRDSLLALLNVCDSESGYLLTTTFTEATVNHEITTGKWRMKLNLEAPPFMLLPPLETITEECTLLDGAMNDKSLGLWRVADIREILFRRRAT